MESEDPNRDSDISGSLASGISRVSISSAGDNSKRPICDECQQPIVTPQFIRAGNYTFHKEHFSCFVCKKLLHDQKTRYKDGHFYCNEDFLDKCCHTCNKCNEKIVQGSVVRALGKYYHHHHFSCTSCDAPFTDGKYYDINGRPYCSIHYAEKKLEICTKCSKPIEDADIVTMNGGSYHLQCLKCCICNDQLAGKGSIFQKQGNMYCRDDYLNLYSKTCSSCGTFIMKQILAVNEEYYHPECLTCFFCKTELREYIAVGGYLRCEEHLHTVGPNIMCTVCDKVINDQDPILSAGHKVHNECFNCSYCSNPLFKTDAKCRNGLLCCTQCCLRPDSSAGSTNNSTNNSKNSNNPATSPSSVQNTYLQSSPTNTTSTTPSYARQATSISNLDQESSVPSPVVQQQAVSSPIATQAAATVPPPAPGSINESTAILDNELSDCAISWRRGDVIGKGSFGKVFLGMNSNTGELLAIKQIPIKDNLELEIQQIVTEIKLMRNLHHPNIVTLLGTQRVGTKLNIIMEYVAGNSIDHLLAKFGPFVENVIQSYTKQLLEALEYCHGNGVVHRDLKGKNVLVDTQGNLKLADFGSAKRFQNVLMKDSPSLSYNYTPLWTAPEVLTGDYNSKVDIWSLGCVVIEMATAKSPWYECNFEHAFRALNHIASSNDIPRIPNSLSKDGKDFLLLCLCRNPDDRPTAKQLLQHQWI